VACPGVNSGYLAGALLLSWLYVGVVHVALSGAQFSLSKTLVYYIQTAMLMLQPDLPGAWLSFLLSVFRAPSAGAGACLFPRSYFGKFVFTLAVPLVGAVQLLLLVAVAWLLVLRRRGPFSVERWLLRPLLSLALASYAPVTSGVLEMLTCRDVVVGTTQLTVLAAAPALRCSGAQYTLFRSVAAALAALWVCGMPAAIAACVAYRHRHSAAAAADDDDTDSKRPVSLLAVVGAYFAECYTAPFWFWEVVAVVRRAALFAALVIPGPASRQFALAVLATAALSLHATCMPLRSVLENRAELLGHAVIAFLAFAHTSQLYETAAQPLGIVLTILFVVPLGVLVAVMVYLRRDQLRAAFRALRSKWSDFRGDKAETGEATSLVQVTP
jgi:hypothetical protein